MNKFRIFAFLAIVIASTSCNLRFKGSAGSDLYSSLPIADSSSQKTPYSLVVSKHLFDDKLTESLASRLISFDITESTLNFLKSEIPLETVPSRNEMTGENQMKVNDPGNFVEQYENSLINSSKKVTKLLSDIKGEFSHGSKTSHKLVNFEVFTKKMLSSSADIATCVIRSQTSGESVLQMLNYGRANIVVFRVVPYYNGLSHYYPIYVVNEHLMDFKMNFNLKASTNHIIEIRPADIVLALSPDFTSFVPLTVLTYFVNIIAHRFMYDIDWTGLHEFAQHTLSCAKKEEDPLVEVPKPTDDEVEDFLRIMLVLQQEGDLEKFLDTLDPYISKEEVKNFMDTKILKEIKPLQNELSAFIKEELDAYLKALQKKEQPKQEKSSRKKLSAMFSFKKSSSPPQNLKNSKRKQIETEEKEEEDDEDEFNHAINLEDFERQLFFECPANEFHEITIVNNQVTFKQCPYKELADLPSLDTNLLWRFTDLVNPSSMPNALNKIVKEVLKIRPMLAGSNSNQALRPEITAVVGIIEKDDGGSFPFDNYNDQLKAKSSDVLTQLAARMRNLPETPTELKKKHLI